MIRGISLIALFATLWVTGCGTIQKPCIQGGEPARDKPFTGKLEKKTCEQTIDKGKAVNHGLYREIYPNGNVALEGRYKMGARDGKWFEWDEKGKLLSERWFEDGQEVPTRAKEAAEAAKAATEAKRRAEERLIKPDPAATPTASPARQKP